MHEQHEPARCAEVIRHESRLDALNERLAEHIRDSDANFAEIYRRIDGLLRIVLYGAFGFVMLVVTVLLIGAERTYNLLKLFLEK